jgi:serine/threonine protein kinase
MVEELREGDPREVGGLRVIGRLGSGASGVVLLAETAEAERVAVKVLHREIAASKEVRRRLRNEAEALRRVTSERVARVRWVETEGPTPHLVMDLVEGETLETMVRRAPLTGPMVAAVTEGLVEALQAIHAAGVVHRDLKPSNVIFGPEGVRVVDFGVSAFDETAGTTRTGALVGTPSWIAPEQATGEEVGPHSDVFLLGMVIAYAASGSHPFGTGRTDAMLFRIVHEEPNLDAVPSALRPTVADCLAKSPTDRPSLAEVAARVRGVDIEQLARELPADRTYAASTTRLGVAALDEVREASTAQAAAPRSRRRSRMLVALAFLGPLLVGALVAYRFLDASGGIVVEYTNASSSNPQLRSPQLIIRGPQGQREVLDLPRETVISRSIRPRTAWKISSELEVEFLPAFEGSEPFVTIVNPRRAGMSVLSRGEDIVIHIVVRDTSTSARITLPAVTGFQPSAREYLALELRRQNEQQLRETARREATRARDECRAEIDAEWSSRVRPALELAANYRDFRRRFGLDDGGTISEARYRNQMVNLIDAMTTEYAVLTLIDPPPSSEVVDSLMTLFDSYGTLLRAWNDYQFALLFPVSRQGLYSDLYPIQHSAMERAEQKFFSDADALRTSLDREIRSACERRHPDPR